MSVYRYIAVSPGAKPSEVLIEAENEKEALSKLRSRQLSPIRYCGEVGEDGGKRFSLRRKRIDTFEFTRQLSPLLDSYIPLERALGIIADSTKEKDQRDFVNSLRQGLHEGKKFSELVRQHGKLFPGYYANLIESGEETGCLPDVVRELHKFMGESKELKDFVVSSSIYPLAILSVTLIVTILLFTVFVPRFSKIFIDMGRDLPPTMVMLTDVGTFMLWSLLAIPLGFLAWLLLRHFFGAAELRWHWSKILLKIPLLGQVMIDLEMCKYIRTLSILIANHVEIIRTVRIAGRIISNPVIARSFDGVDRKLKGGDKLSGAFRDNPYLPHSLTPMLRVGEESGTVGEMLIKIAGNLENDTRLKIKRLLSLFEPAVIVFLALVVLVVVVSIFVAMMEINSISQGGSI